jgi:hypothetical protein
MAGTSLAKTLRFATIQGISPRSIAILAINNRDVGAYSLPVRAAIS